jgi:quercetin dioxygenase-like cupin family protein
MLPWSKTMALSATLADGLDTYSIGPKVRELRTARQMGLVELGAHTGLSAGLLSKIERGNMYPTLPTLLRIAMVFSVGLDHFFSDQSLAVSVVRKRDRIRLPDKASSSSTAYTFESLDFEAKERRFNTFLAEFQSTPVDDIKLHKHSGDELLYVLEGSLGLYINNQETVLETGDSVYFNATLKHGYRRVGRKPCRAIVVTMP